MAAYLIGQIKVKDPQRWKRYVAGVDISLEPFKAKLLMRGEQHQVLAGNNSFEFAVVIKFEQVTELERWFQSEAYQALIPLREQAADVSIISYKSSDTEPQAE
ncbi:DUF1330 domain-containing protein [Agarivorans sp. QJM3NY_29]|uniref:DUF1330 domain-containing protein n=1 Tax=unclassified Agarivorans TaxID=2636026 RepID=UPI003D7E0470